MKTRVNGILETIQQKMVSHQLYQTAREELKDAKDSIELLKQKVIDCGFIIRPLDVSTYLVV